MRQHFLSSDYEGILFTKYHQCSQGITSVPEYSREMSSQNNLSEIEEQLIDYKIRIGFKKQVSREIDYATPTFSHGNH